MLFTRNISRLWAMGTIVVCGLLYTTYIFSNAPSLQCSLSPNYPHGEKWIVVTSVNYPTNDVKGMCELKDWHIVIVADLKTPLDWAWPGCALLTVKDQLACYPQFSVPFNSYTRKMYGYLFAIRHGAQMLVDCDDDNKLEQLPTLVSAKRQLHSTHLVANVYAAFGRPDVWPRGFPLELLGQANTSIVPTLVPVEPAIVQNLVSADADTDGMYRLTHRHELGHMQFENNEPVAVTKGTFSPFNSQSTLFSYEAFWGLFLPTTVSFRTTDIWRGFYSQRLLWELDANRRALVFTAPTTKQIRNFHDLVDDLHDEEQMYRQAGNLVNFLKKYSLDATVNLSQFMVQLAKDMARAGFWGWDDVDLIEQWLYELNKAGYILPLRR